MHSLKPMSFMKSNPWSNNLRTSAHSAIVGVDSEDA